MSPLSLTWCLPPKSQSNASYLSLKTRLRNCWVCTPLWNLDGPELQESVFSFEKPRFSNLNFFIYLIYFLHQCFNLDSKIPEADCSFLGISNISVHRNWNLHRAEVEKVILLHTCLEIPTRPSRELQLWILVSGSTTGLLHWKISGSISFIGLDSSIKISIDNFFLSEMRFFNIKCCMFNLSYLCGLDGKYHRATAPFVLI